MRRTIHAYLQLVRLPNVIAAAADSLAGWLLATGDLSEPARWLPLLAASMALYAGGTALNDVFDRKIDRAERPGRPLPSGRASARLAAWLGGLGLALGPLIAWSGRSIAGGTVAAALAGCILAYDAGLKHTPIGPIVMGACRGLNLLLGMTSAAGLGGPIAWTAAALYGLFVVGITAISRSEARGDDPRGLTAGLAFQNVALFGLAAVAMAHERFPNPSPERPLLPIEGLLVLALTAIFVNQAAVGALKRPTPQSFQKTVKIGILSLVWLNVGLVAAVRGVGPAALVAAFWFPAVVLGRWLYAT